MASRGTSPVIINEIKRLSQEEGLKDGEIADIIGYNRVSVQRIRSENGIPKCNYSNRRDKPVTCPQCGKEYMIRRNEFPGISCPECTEKTNVRLRNLYEEEVISWG
mgnify:CR=1 FL=1